jgi:hypothetical protein
MPAVNLIILVAGLSCNSKCSIALSPKAEELKLSPGKSSMRAFRASRQLELVASEAQIVWLYERDVLTEQITHRAMLEPMSMQSPFAAGRNKLVADQCFQDVQPARSFARGQ